MSRIVIDARELRTSSGRYVERLLNSLQEIDQVNDYQILLKPKDIDGWRPTNPKFSKVPSPYKEFTIDEQTGLKKQIEALNADLVHFAFAQQPIRYKGKTVSTIHDLTTLRFNNPDKNWLVFKFKQKVYAYVIKRSVRKASAVITGSEYVKDDVANFTKVRPDKITVTYEAADKINDEPEMIASLAGKPFIMYVGRPTPHKNLERLIEAFQDLQNDHPDLRLVLAGKLDNNYCRIQAAVAKKSIKNVVFTDFVSEGQLRWLYENCRAYVFPSLSEGFGLPGLEAMAHGAPVISSNATCLPEIYGNAAHYFDPLNVSAITQATAEVLNDEDLRRTLLIEGRKQIAKYSWRRMAQQTLEIYKEVLT